MAKISVIVPVYNTQKYLDICLDSIISQTFEDFEVICINDGSTDNSLKLLERYSEFDKRIKVYTTKNQGLSEARNTGLKLSTGDYVTYIDSDDWISPVMLERLYKNITANDSDYVFCSIRCVNPLTNEAVIWDMLKPEDKEQLQSISKKPFFTEGQLDSSFYFKMHSMACAKLYKREFIKDFKFPAGLIFEDAPFFANCYLKACRISYDDNPLYYYRQNRTDSITGSSNPKYKDIFAIYNLVKQVFIENGKYEKYKTRLLLKKMQDVFYRMAESDEIVKRVMFNMTKEDFREFGNFEKIDLEGYDYAFLKTKTIFHIFKNIMHMNFEEYSAYEKRLLENAQN